MQIRIRHPDGAEERVALDASRTIRLGTHRAADVVLRGAGIFPVHFGILRHGGQFMAVASKQARKIRVNGTRVHQSPLSIGDRIEVGQTLVEVLASESNGTVSGDTDRRGEPDRADQSMPDSGQDVHVEPVGPVNLESLDELDADALSPFVEISTDLLEPVDGDTSVESAVPYSKPVAPAEPCGPGPVARFFRSTWFRAGLVLSVLVPLVVLVGVYVHQLPSATDRFQAANRLYQQGDFVQAREGFSRFLLRYPRNAHGGEARVKRDLAYVLRELDRGASRADLLTELTRLVDGWGTLRRQAAAQQGLAEILPLIVAELLQTGQAAAQRGAKDTVSAAVTQASQALDLIYRHVPPELQDRCGVDWLQFQLTRLERDESQSDALNAVVGEIAQAAREGGINLAYDKRNDLLNRYPLLASSGRLLDAMRAAGRTQAARVEAIAPLPQPLPGTDAGLWRMQVVCAPAPNATASTSRSTSVVGVVVPEAGAVYALDATNGQILWRRNVGFETDVSPYSCSGGDLLLVDSTSGDASRISATTGEPRWRLPLGPIAGAPVVDGTRAVVVSRDGVLTEFDIESGRVHAQWRLPQAIRVAPVLDSATRLCQVAEHSMLYVVSRKKNACVSSYYLGHERGAVARSPLVIHGHLVIFEGSGPRRTEIHVLKSGDELESVQTLALDGPVVSDPVARGDLLYVPTSSHTAQILQWKTSDPRRPLELLDTIDIPRTPARHEGPLYLAVVNEQMWAVGDGISVFTAGRSTESHQITSRVFEDVQFTQPPILRDRQIIVAGRPVEGRGLTVAAWDVDGSSQVWHCTLAQPPAAPLLVAENGTEAWALLSDGTLCRVDANGLSDTGRSILVADPRESFPGHGVLDPGRGFAFWSENTGVLGPLESPAALTFVEGGAPTAEGYRFALPRNLAVAPVRFGDHLLLAFQRGPLCTFDVARRRFTSHPILPPASLVAPPRWKGPAVLSDQQAVVADGNANLLLVQQREDRDGLEIVRQVKLEQPLQSGLIAVEDTVWGVDQQQSLIQLQAPGLTVAGKSALAGTVEWGPVLVGGNGYLATDRGVLVCLGETSEPRWEATLGVGPIVGACPIGQRHMALASKRGFIVVLETATGRQASRMIDARQPLAFGPVAFESRLSVMTEDACLLVVRAPVSELLENRKTATTDPSDGG